MSLLKSWIESATDRSDFAALLQEPVMQKALNIVKEAIFTPINIPQGLMPSDRMAYLGEMGLRREMGLEFLHKFESLAKITPLKDKAQALQKTKSWSTADEEAGKKKILEDFYSGAPPPIETVTELAKNIETPATPPPSTPE